MAFAIEHKTKMAFVIGTNQGGELGLSKEDEGQLIDTEQRKVFTVQDALKEKPVEMAALGKAGYVLAIGAVINPGRAYDEEMSQNTVG